MDVTFGPFWTEDAGDELVEVQKVPGWHVVLQRPRPPVEEGHIYIRASIATILFGDPENFEQKLVGGLEHFFSPHILGIIIPIDFHIFQMG